MDRTSDMQLVLDARQGDPGALRALVERHRIPALRLAYGIAGDEAEDAVQDAFVKAFRNLDGFRLDAAFRPWLFTIVANEARNRRRAMTRRTKLELRLRTRGEIARDGTDDLALEHDQRRRLLDALTTLPERDREVLSLRFFAGLSEQETAAVLACPAGTAKSRVSRALDRLRAALGEEVTL